METECETAGDREVKIIAEKEYWTTSKAARYLGLSKVSLLNHVKAKHLKYLRFGMSVFYQQVWLDEYIDEKTNMGDADGHIEKARKRRQK